MDEPNYKKLFIRCISAISLLLVAIAVFVISIDPYQQYRSRSTYCGNQRLEIGGIAKNQDYNAFFTGSSMSMNHYPGQVDSLWGWKTKNFSLMGATYNDYQILLPYILSQGKAKNIILNIDFFTFARDRSVVDSYLYDDNIWNDYEYIYNYTSLKNCINILLHPTEEEGLYHFQSPSGRKYLKEAFDKAMKQNEYEGENYSFELLKKNFDNSILPILINSSDSIQWFVYYPPYSIGEFIVLDHYGVLENVLKFKDYMTHRLSNINNLRLYDFQTKTWITNLEQYMDLRHHSHYYNRAIMEAIHKDSDRVHSHQSSQKEIHSLIEIYRDSI